MNLRPLELWKTLSRKTIFHHSKFLTVENHTVKLPTGQIIPDWAWIITPDAALILAETSNHKYLCFHQTKYAVGTTLAPVGGHVEPGEDPMVAAKRELLEETGYQATEWIHLGSYIVGPNRGIAKRHLYFARNATKIASPQNDDLEEQQLLLLNRSELENALREGKFKIVSWVSLIALSLQYMQNK